jgi:hypothetical protein
MDYETVWEFETARYRIDLSVRDEDFDPPIVSVRRMLSSLHAKADGIGSWRGCRSSLWITLIP